MPSPRNREDCTLILFTTNVILGMVTVNKQEIDYITSFVGQNPNLILDCYIKLMSIADTIKAMNYREVPWPSDNDDNREEPIPMISSEGIDDSELIEKIIRMFGDL